MIEKLDLRENVEIIPIKGSCHDYCLAKSSVLIKINELVDAVNELQEMNKSCDSQISILAEQIAKLQHDNSGKANCQENVQDKFAEQRRWIGKLCMFWDNDATQEFSYGVLTKIDTETGFGVQYCCNDEYDYDDCQPVKPDDDIIYKGGDNE